MFDFKINLICYNLLVKIGGNKNWLLAETMIKAKQTNSFSLSCEGRYPVCQVFISSTQTRKSDALAG